MIWTGDERRIKVFERKQFFKGLGRRNSYLTLPGRDCMDVQLGIDLSVLGEDTRITAVERSKTVFAYISKWFLQNWPGATPGPILTSLCDLTDLVPLDLVFLDYLGNPTHDDAYWIRNHLRPQLLPGARVGITACKCYRNNHLLAEIRSLLVNRHQDYFWRVQHTLRKAGLPKSYYDFSAMYYILVRCYLLYNYAYEFEPCYYRENKHSATMMLFNVSNIQKGGIAHSPEEDAIFSEINRIVDRKHKGSLLHTVTDVRLTPDNPVRPSALLPARRPSILPASTIPEGDLPMPDSRISEFVARFFEVQQLREPTRNDKMRGLKRSITVYAQSAKDIAAVYRQIKGLITKKGGDASLIEPKPMAATVKTTKPMAATVKTTPKLIQGQVGRVSGDTLLTMTMVVQKLFVASTSGEKASAGRLKARYIDQQVNKGKSRDYLERWVKARLTSMVNASV
jgi:hypothetical protein